MNLVLLNSKNQKQIERVVFRYGFFREPSPLLLQEKKKKKKR